MEKEWLDTLGAVDVDEVNYKDFVTVGKELSKKLRDEVVYEHTVRRLTLGTASGRGVRPQMSNRKC